MFALLRNWTFSLKFDKIENFRPKTRAWNFYLMVLKAVGKLLVEWETQTQIINLNSVSSKYFQTPRNPPLKTEKYPFQKCVLSKNHGKHAIFLHWDIYNNT